MAHLKDKVADFFYKELSAAEMTDATRHFEDCSDCRRELQQFERMHMALRSAPDFDPPRNIVLSEPQPSAWLRWFDWRPIAVSTAAAALVAGIIVRLSPVAAPAPAILPPTLPAVAAPVSVQAEKIDYDRIVNTVRESDRQWLAGVLQSRDREIQRLRAEVAYYDTFQRAVMKETLENGSAIQLLAQRTEQR